MMAFGLFFHKIFQQRFPNREKGTKNLKKRLKRNKREKGLPKCFSTSELE
jgi:hypothetical protein